MTSEPVLCVAPHPDDETLGCGGALLRHVARGDAVHWLIVTSMHAADGFTQARIDARNAEIERVASAYGFAGVHRAELPTTRLDTLPKSHVVDAVSAVMKLVQPRTIYLPYRNDAHSDHAVVADATTACCKSFRYPCVRRVRAYETPSETEFGMRVDDRGFHPNLFVDVSDWVDRKIEIMRMYAGEMHDAPFPRSETVMRALATFRGTVAGVAAAEAFVTLREIE